MLQNDKKNMDQSIREEIRHFQNAANIHGQLSDIFRYWQTRYFKERFTEIFRANNHLEFYALPFMRSILASGCANLVSFGTGDAQVEVGVAQVLKRKGIEDFFIYCIELAPGQIERARGHIGKAGLDKHFCLIEADFNSWDSGGKVFAGAMAHHALHHVLGLEHLVQEVRNALHPEGVFCTIDVIGRNGHMRWPEALEIIERIWRFLPESKKYHHILKRTDHEYVNHDCSTEGFEGIRSQDILPLLVKTFSFESFHAFGNLVDVFTSRGFGANFDAQSQEDMAFIDFVEYLNELLIDLGHLKPTRMAAVMRIATDRPPVVYKNWTPEFCVRRP